MILLTITALCAFVWSTYNFAQKYRTTHQLSQQHAATTTQNIAATLNDKLTRLTAAANDLADHLQNQPLSTESVTKNLQQAALNHTGFYALGVAFDFYAVSPQQRLYAPFIKKDQAIHDFDRIDRYYDYIGNHNQLPGKGNHWYHAAVSGQRGWLEPYFDRAHRQFILRHIRPLQQVATAKTQKVSAGAVFVDIDLEWIRQQVENFDVGDNGYAIIINDQNQVLYHGLLGSKKVIEHLIQNHRSADIGNFESGKLGTNELTGRLAWKHRFPVGETGWHVLTVMNAQVSKQDLFSHHEQELVIQKSDITLWIVNVVILCLLVYTCWAFYRRQHSNAYLLRHAFVASLFLMLGIIAVWVNEYHQPFPGQSNSLVLSNRAIVEQFQNDYALRSLQESRNPPLFIPTGLFIQTIEFLSATNISISGYVWQRYSKRHEEMIDHGVIFPEAIEMTVTEAYRNEEGNEIVRGWYFEATLREAFDYRIYPFDKQLLWIRLWHKNFTDNVVLIPDFKSFDNLNPATLPGVERDFVLSEWDLKQAFFDIRVNQYNSNFGNSQFTGHDKVPELYYNIEISRLILNPIIAHLFPLYVVLLMLYALVLTISRQDSQLAITGFNVSTVIASCSALFFILLIMHVQLRDELAFNTIVYVEYFYLISYITILMVTINAVLFSHNQPLKIIAFKDNLIPKLAYWPVLFIWIFVITTILFL